MISFLLAGVVISALLLSDCRSGSSDGNDFKGGTQRGTDKIRVPSSQRSQNTSTSKSIDDLTHRKPCPKNMALIDDFCIDRFEAHLLLNGKIHPHNLRPPEGEPYQARSLGGVFPQAYISRLEAQQACVRSGKRLCSLREWYRACEGAGRKTYSYGEDEIKGRCNSGKPPIFFEVFKEKTSQLWSYEKHFNNPLLNITPGFLEKTGGNPECHSDEGVYDMVGNVHEWVTDNVNYDLQNKIKLSLTVFNKLPRNYGHAIFMGGFYSTGHQFGSGCQYMTIDHGPQYHDYSTGFRCCQDPQR